MADDQQVVVKQLIFTLNYKYNQKFEVKFNDIELYPEEFHLYQSPEDIDVDTGLGVCELVVELFVPVDSTDEYINEIKQQVFLAMEQWFDKKIYELNYGLEVLAEQRVKHCGYSF